jgi:protein TonB
MEEMPEFPGGDMEMRIWIARSLRYPEFAQEHDIKGKVYVQFIIMEDGSLSDISIWKSVHDTVDAEAVRVIQSMPKWKPARQNGKAARVLFTVPIKFGR